MKAKTIRKAIRAKVDAWLESIEDLEVRKIAAKNTIVTGGCIASMLLKEEVNDFDIYFRTQAAAKAIAEYYVKRFTPGKKEGIAVAISVQEKGDRIKIVVKSAGIASAEGTDKPYEYFESRPEGEAAGYVSAVMQDPGDIQDAYDTTKEMVETTDEDPAKPKYRPIFLSTNAITLSHKIQIVLRFHGEPDAIHENYDFTHCTNYWTSWGEEAQSLTLRPEALECLLARELRYQGSKYPVCSVFRLRKFIKRNWTVNAGQILKMCMQISALDLTKVETLEDQLTGVDCAYFAEVIAKLKEKDQTAVDSAYLIEIIQRMF
jgi:hypothetical protein